ncbi:Ldh family oxidoreductase [Amycolatopsis jiangsuensis]|uniref:LDH2 family malate/lactate/ureidoglycolate dehydrogenase n=1 Tax=Amycolatopsis jiangsuensis TaxID=1181879 RepID=A0A840J0J2_9PSEU|nr:Ldh family oxidoreductase [Amycolatopsis jiangsuensis]MBB4686962.1 LDH2 family malate/lactate/ureidoglycolate dehydrogenase [Amycolatopsis jiangsuensis]
MPLRPRSRRPAPSTAPTDTRIPEQAWHRVPADELVTLVSLVLTAHGFPDARARMAAEALCHGDLTGAPDTGVQQLLQLHLPAVESGFVSPGAEPLLIADRGAAALIDYRRASGLWAVGDAMDRAVVRAGRFGVGLVSMRGAGPFGRAGHHAARALPHGMIGLVLAAGGVEDQPAHPLGMAAPAGAYPEFMLDVDLGDAARNPQFAGFALMVDVLAGVLSGVADHEHDTGLLVMAIAPTTLRSADGFYRAASALFGSMLGWEGGGPIRYPGWREAQYLEQCRALGVPLSASVRRQLDSLALKLSLPPLTTVG